MASAAATREEADDGNAAKKKRPAWDVKGRLQDLEENHTATQSQLQDSKSQLTSMTDELSRSRSTIDELLQFRKSLENQVVVKEKENHTYAQQLSDLKDQLQSANRRHEDELHTLATRHNRSIADLTSELTALQRLHATTVEDLTASRSEATSLRSTISSQSASQIAMEADLRANRLRVEQMEDTIRIRDERIAGLEKERDGLVNRADGLEGRVREEETMRRRLHNTIQELKGNIRVFCRVRPPLPHEREERTDDILTHIGFAEKDETAIELKQAVESASGQKSVEKTYPFTFDRVFQPEAPQTAVFDEISQLVQSALDGYNVCIFAYGQTGSGKTFTMEGPDNVADHPEDMGMIPRAVHQIFESAQALEEKGWAYDMEAQFLEIYNETIRDLAGGSNGSAAGVGGGGDVGGQKHEIKHHPTTGRTSVTDISTVQVKTPKEVHRVLSLASHNRAVASTNCNERSSRSHSVFTLRLTGVNSLTGERSHGILNLIDLAGSERLSSSGSTGDRLKETQAINKSLSCLGDVVCALANGDRHVPYRNSKLTYLLQGSLGGNSKTLMFVNVSPLATNFQETLCSLRFATKVNACQIGTAKKTVK
ncbi:kinesin-like nuclear fusion protein [Thoreauomyces humboldtii]|nr:kinesin-like nuclear fusion protein [Thoreauomyces humboldtii]